MGEDGEAKGQDGEGKEGKNMGKGKRKRQDELIILAGGPEVTATPIELTCNWIDNTSSEVSFSTDT